MSEAAPTPGFPPELAPLFARAQETARAGRRQEAITVYGELLHALDPRTQSALAALVLRWIGRTYLEDGQPDVALDSLTAALAAAEGSRNESCAAHVLNMMAVCRWQLGELDDAERLYREAQAVATRAGERSLGAMIDQNLGIMASVRGDDATALVHFERGLAGYRALGMREYLAPLLNNIGLVHTESARWAEADAAFAQALTTSAEVEDLRIRLVIEANRAKLAVLQHELERARESCDVVIALADPSADHQALGEAHKVRGAIAREEGAFAEAAAELALARRIAEERRDLLLAAETLSEEAELHWRQQRNRESVRCLSQSYRLFSQLGAQRHLAVVGRRARRLEQLFEDVVLGWAKSIESKDRYTRGHCERVADYACALAADVGFEPVAMFWFRVGALLHDLGKIIVPSSILNKPGPLTAEEHAIMQRHPLAGAELLRDVEFPWDVLPIIRSHHERWDGQGYPDGQAGETIPLAARILRIADMYDALTTARPYRDAFASDEALEIMARDAGSAIDPALFTRFRKLIAGPRARVTPPSGTWALPVTLPGELTATAAA